ncbi:MAG TPA: PaeR7I family type II restriction endonuclease [Archangium sp.]|nr:PaeR7I family type II restriction endonuclease [Archangium sp.]
MGAVLTDDEARLGEAIAWYWRALNQPTSRLEGFHALVSRILADNGLPEARVHTRQGLELPGYFLPTRPWDLVVMHEGRLVAALAIRSRTARSLENGFVALGEEALSTGKEMDALCRKQAFGPGLRPWFGWLVLLEEGSALTRPAAVAPTLLQVVPEYRHSTHAQWYELLLRKLEREGLFDACALLLCPEERQPSAHYREPARDLGGKRFLAHLASHAGAFAACL